MVDNWYTAFPSHVARPIQGRCDGIENRTIPELLKGCPTALNGIVFTVIGRIINQLQAQLALSSKAHQALDKLGAIRASRAPPI